jgi:hypothetical protein
MGRVVRDDDIRSRQGIRKQAAYAHKVGNAAIQGQNKIERYNTKNAGAQGLANAGAVALGANQNAYNQQLQAGRYANQQRLQLGQIVNSQQTYDSNWMVGAAAGAANAYTGIMTQQKKDEQLANAHSLGQSMYADRFNGGY